MSAEPTTAPTDLVEVGHCRVLRDVACQPGVETVEGRLVPLMAGEAMRSHVIVMHPGQYCWPHPHDTESLIYTISGRWVFCTTDDGTEDGEEVRVEIGEGDLFHFVAGVPTGFETPFDETAVILIFKGSGGSYESMMEGMQDAKESLEQMAADGEVFRLDQLPEDHPARNFVTLS